ncbi:unnamed protein product [Adineta steineri]|uniref:Neural proliferation differentiation and control protein 1 n=2 Tax=Adineta steineri TaxID=433720 RepID=A0A813XI65_9BILA|nr:unnamed protein product [Adineta steineri]CAF1357937.1 unnamed protein product [Adineta steineri]
MMKKFISNNVTILILVIITITDAARIFYLPLPKIHPSHHELKSTPTVQDSETKIREEKSISNEFIPLAAMERYMYQEQDEEGGISSWDDLTDTDTVARQHIDVNELPSETERNLASSNYENLSNDETNGDASWLADTANSVVARLQSTDVLDDATQRQKRNDTLFLVIVGSCSLVGVLGLVAAAVFWYRIQRQAEALENEYPSYGVTGPGTSGSKISPSATISDRKLAQSAQMFHYQQQRQQMMAQEKAHLDAKPVHSDDSDDETPGGGDYTVYECPGLAPTGEMEVRNPLFAETDSPLTPTTSTSHPATNNHYPQLSTTLPLSSSPPAVQEKSSS